MLQINSNFLIKTSHHKDNKRSGEIIETRNIKKFTKSSSHDLQTNHHEINKPTKRIPSNLWEAVQWTINAINDWKINGKTDFSTSSNNAYRDKFGLYGIHFCISTRCLFPHPPPFLNLWFKNWRIGFVPSFFFFYENQEEKHRNELNYEEIYELKYYPNCRTKTHTIHVITL